MIFYLNGKLDQKNDDHVVVDVNGVGHLVYAPTVLIQDLPNPNSEVKLYTYHHIREDQQTLYGFSSVKDREVFLTITSISGIGPKVGIKILSAAKTEELITAILQKDLHLLTSIPGVGKKVAERIIVELSDKLHKLYPIDIPNADKVASFSSVSSELEGDLTLALKSLGYSADEIKKSIRKSSKTLSDGCSLEDGIKILLKNL